MNRTHLRPTRRPSALARPILACLAVGGSAILTIALGGTAGAAPQQPDGDLVSNISITTTPAAVQPPCAVGTASLGYEVENDPSAFTLRVTAAAPLCSPVVATAAIYGMPGNGIAWPQELVEYTSFTIAEAGDYTVTFTKTCLPAQFDVLTGATPQTIAPWGEWHGPLLFPGDIDTAHQHWGGGCAPVPTTAAPTTVVPTTTTSTSTPTTTTVPAASPEITTTTFEVLSVTEEQPPVAPLAQPVVLGVSEEQAQPAGLAFTGFGFGGTAVAGAALVLAGLLMAAAGRREQLRTD